MSRIRFERAARTMVISFAAILWLSFIDAVTGGGLSLMLSADNYWSPYDQIANHFYQLLFGIFCAAVIVGLVLLRMYRESIAVLIMLLGYAEDVLFYVLSGLAISVIDLISGIDNISRVRFPGHYSGWIGWLARVFGTWFSMDPDTAMVFMILSFVAAAAIAMYGNVFALMIKTMIRRLS